MADLATDVANEATLSTVSNHIEAGLKAQGMNPTAVPGWLTLLLSMVTQFLNSGGCTPTPTPTPAKLDEVIADLKARAEQTPRIFKAKAVVSCIENGIPHPRQSAEALHYATMQTDAPTIKAFASISTAL
jgi:hypothetical protein